MISNGGRNDGCYHRRPKLTMRGVFFFLIFIRMFSARHLLFYLAFAYILRSHEIASHVTSSSVRVLISSKVDSSNFVLPKYLRSSCVLPNRRCPRRPSSLRTIFLPRKSETSVKKTRNRFLTIATLSFHAPHNNSRIKQPLLQRKLTHWPTQYSA